MGFDAFNASYALGVSTSGIRLFRIQKDRIAPATNRLMGFSKLSPSPPDHHPQMDLLCRSPSSTSTRDGGSRASTKQIPQCFVIVEPAARLPFDFDLDLDVVITAIR